jgi:hypothetical protein
MKKYYSLLFALLAVMAMALVFVSCKKEIDYEEPKPESKNQMTFTTEHPVGKTMWVFLKKDERPTEVIGAKEIYGENPFDGGIPINEIILGLKLENQTVTIKGDITYIEFNEPKLTTLDVSNNPILEYLSLHYNNSHLASLDVSKNTALTTLICDGSQLEELDVSKNTALQNLSCEKNNLTSLDVSKCPKLSMIWCGYNKFTSLDISKNPELRLLHCQSNKIKAEEMSKIINSLPDWSEQEKEGYGNLYTTSNSTLEENEITEEDVKIAKEKNWKVLTF